MGKAMPDLSLVSTSLDERRTVRLAANQTLVIGRADECDVQLHDRWMSRRHCEITVEGDEVWIRDLGSTHGTLVNEQPVIEQRLREGDVIRLGLTSFRVERQAGVHLPLGMGVRLMTGGSTMLCAWR